MTVKVVINDKQFRAWMTLFKNNIGRLTVAFQDAASIMEADIFKHFNSDQKNEDGAPWPPVKQDPGKGSLLIRNGTLRQSIFKRWSRENAEVGTALVYAAAHNFGMSLFIRPRNARFLSWIGRDGQRFFSTGHQVTIPQREFLWISEDAKTRIEKAFMSESIIPK